MKLALTVWNERIAPVFDSAGSAVILETRDGVRGRSETLDLDTRDPDKKARTLQELGVQELICGAISREAEATVRNHGITVHSFIAGDVETVIRAWGRNELQQEEFSMPGCACARRRRARNRCRGMSNADPQR